jgi:DNA mismatch repair protein MutS2
MQIFPETSMLTSEFMQIRQYCMDYCLGNHAKNKIRSLNPSSDFAEVNRLLQQVNALKASMDAGIRIPIDYYPELEPVLRMLHIENSRLTPEQFMQIKSVVLMAEDIIRFNEKNRDIPELFELTRDVQINKEIVSEINNVFDASGRVLSSASRYLEQLRYELQKSRAEADHLYQRLLIRYRKEDWLADTSESFRHGRRVIAVHAAFKRAVKGTIHDISSSGKTVFIEPDETIEINNLILEKEYEEQNEILRILHQLTSRLRKYGSTIAQCYELVSVFDVLRAKVLLAQAMNAAMPVLTDKPSIQIKDGFHPLLLLQNKAASKKTVSFSLSLNDNLRIIIISGPNAGGKSVCLKAVGLLQLMLQSGFLIPVSPQSEIGIFTEVMCDIGDSQSLEYELSTYSSRLRNMKVFLEHAGRHTLFLIDEFGTGTDPQLGGALAESILIELNKRNAKGLVTTHFMNLKILASNTPGIMNASMAFDSKNLEPLYELVHGKPGSSYTFVVAQRSGLPWPVIQRAKSRAAKDFLILEKLLNEAEREKANIEKLKAELKRKEKLSDEILKKAEHIAAEMEQFSLKSEQQLAKKELMLIRKSEELLSKFFRDFTAARNKKAVMEEYRQRFRTVREKMKPAPDEAKAAEELKKRLEKITVGTEVTLNSGKTKGIVKELKNGKAMVQFGAMKVQCEVKNLYPWNDTDERKK